VSHERIPLPGWERRHLVRLGVLLMFEDDREVALLHVNVGAASFPSTRARSVDRPALTVFDRVSQPRP
jgi:hypothetical protein